MTAELHWYFMGEGRSQGPVSEARLLELLESGQINRQTSIWHEGAASWDKLEKALGLSENEPPPIPGQDLSSSLVSPNFTEPAKQSSMSSLAYTSYSDTRPHPWRRYFARVLDIAIGGTGLTFIIFILIAVIRPDDYNNFAAWFETSQGKIALNAMAVGLAMFPNALVIGFTGMSVGKWIYGIRVTNLDGQPIGFQRALYRELLIFLGGLGLGIPLIAFITLIISYNHLKKEKATSWDKAMNLRISQRPDSRLQAALNVVGVILYIAIFAFIVWLSNV